MLNACSLKTGRAAGVQTPNGNREDAWLNLKSSIMMLEHRCQRHHKAYATHINLTTRFTSKANMILEAKVYNPMSEDAGS